MKAGAIRPASAGRGRIGAALKELHRSEADLAGALVELSDRNKADHEVFHVARDLATWSREHVRRLADTARGHGVELAAEPRHEHPVLQRVKQEASELVGRHRGPSLVLLDDLRDVHLAAVGVSLDWEVLAQAAQAMKDPDLLSLAQDCHPQTLRQMRWANAKLKETAVQAIVTG